MAAGVDAARATPEQIAVLEASHPKAKTSDYDLLPRGAGTDARERAIVRLSIDLASRPSDFGAAQLDAAVAAGPSPLELLDATHAVAIFAWANRLMLNLGEPVFPARGASARAAAREGRERRIVRC